MSDDADDRFRVTVAPGLVLDVRAVHEIRTFDNGVISARPDERPVHLCTIEVRLKDRTRVEIPAPYAVGDSGAALALRLFDAFAAAHKARDPEGAT